MKRKTVKKLCALTVSAVMMAGTLTAMAAETEGTAETETAAESTAETETEVDKDTAELYPAIVFEDGAEEVTVANWSQVEITKAEITEEDGIKILTMTDADGKTHIFKEADGAEMEEAALVENGSFLALNYRLEDSNEEEELMEEGEEIIYEKSKPMYVVNKVNVREEADGEAKILSVAELGSEVEAIGELPKWYKVKLEEGEGYIARSYLSEDKESAEQAVEAEEAAVAQAQAAAAQAQAAAAAQAAAQAQAAPQGKYEVSRQAFDDCDGSGHGYYEITYSDGSTAIQEY